tara:strand:+ start:78 stop:935 length:858 start_codon:yes stop_codon:yes gene_type:complete
MIYKFIDNNGSEISVNSLESLQGLVDSDTINESTKVKAGLRGKWTTATAIEGLNFIKEEEIQNNLEPEEDIKSFITQSESSTPQEEIKEEPKTKVQEDDEYEYVEEIVEEEVEVDEDNNEDTGDNSDYYTEKFNIQNEGEEESMGLNLPEAVKTGFKKYFDFKGRASRSEYWYFILFIFLGYGAGILLMLITPVLLWLLGIFFIGIIIPAIAVTARRLHDIDKSGWFQAIPIPAGIIETVFAMNRNATGEMIFLIIGLGCYIYLIVLYCTAGDSKQNRFGKNPLK